MSNFSRLLNASARITYMSERILSYRLLNVSLSFRAQSVKETCLRFVIFNFSEKLQNIFEIGLKIMECSYKNRTHCKKISKEKIRRQVFVVYVLIYLLSKFGGNQTNSLWLLAFYSVRFKWKKNWFERTVLNMSIRRVIFTSRPPKLKTTISLPVFNVFENFRWKVMLRPIH